MTNPLKNKLIRLSYSFALIAMILSGINRVSAQPGVGISFNFSTTGAAAVAGTVLPISLGLNQDDTACRVSPPGMNVRFQGRQYTSFAVSSNGWVALLPAGTPAGVPASLVAGGYLNTNQLSNNTTGFPILAPYWDDLSCTILQWNWTAPILTVQWFARINKTAPTAAANFLLKINGTTGVITYSYANNAYAAVGPPSASIGVAGVCTGDYYSYDNVSTWADSTVENSNIDVRPNNMQYIFTPYQVNDNCAAAIDLGPLTGTCTPAMFNINSAITSGSSMSCSPLGTDVADVWLKVSKPAGITSVTITTSSAAPACQSVAGTSIEAYSVCGGPAISCATTGSNAGFGELVLTRPSCPETLYIRVTADNDAAGKFNICASGALGGATGTTCAAATSICPPLPFNDLGRTTAGFINNYNDSLLCQSDYLTGEDYVYSFTPTTSACLDIWIDGAGTSTYPGLFVLDGCPTDTETATCVAFSTNISFGDTINNLFLTAGHTYYIIVDNNRFTSGINNIPFNFHMANSVTSAPAYDNCANAVSLGVVPSTAACSWSPTFTTKCATPSPVPGYPQPYCGGFTAALTNDVWLSFTAGFSGILQISGRGAPASPTPVTHGGFAIYTGTCGALTLVGCAGDSVAIPFQPVTSIPVTSLQQYYIRYFSATGFEPGEFQICFQANCSPPNDLPTASTLITLGVPLMGDNTCSTGLSEMVNPVNCTTAPINTVWFRLIAPPSGQVAIRISQLSLLDAAVAAFLFPTGPANCATSFTNLACNDDIVFAPPCPICGLTGDNDAAIQFSTVPGATVYVAVDGEFSAVGSFWITAIEGTLASPFPPLFRKDCGNAENVCTNANYTIPNGGIGSDGNICDFLNVGCSSGGVATSEVGSSWISFTVPTGSQLGFTITPNDSAAPIANFNFYLWDVTSVPNICSALTTAVPIRCNTSPGVGKTGLRNPITLVYSDIIPAQGTPRNYMLFVENLTAANDDEGVPGTNTGFVLDWDIYFGGLFVGKTQLGGASAVSNWTGTVVDTQYTNVVNWKGVGSCPASVPTCAIDVNISPASQICVLNGNSFAKNLVINAGGTLKLNNGANLHICGDFTNNGTLNALPGSTITFEGSGVQTINGSVSGANSMASLVINKLNSTLVTLNSNLDLKQNFTTSNGTSVFNINRKYMKVGGNFSNFNGTTTFPIALLGGSTIEFNGGINQLFTNTNGTINFNNVIMNKTGGKLYLTTANSTINIDSLLTLTSGIIVTRAFPNLEVNMKYYLPASLIGPLSAASYIDGKLRRKISKGTFSTPTIPASYDFPLGDSLTPGGYNLANILFTQATLITDIQGTFTPWTPGPPAAGPLTSECIIATYDGLPIFNNGYWTFLRTGTNPAGQYTMTLNNFGFTNNLGAGWTVAKSDILADVNLATSWNLTGSCVPSSTSTNTQRSLINPSPGADSTSFNLNYVTVQSVTPLPIELLYFTAEPKGEIVQCKWETATEINNEYFEVERSEDGKNFEWVGKMPGYGLGTTTEKREYSLIDNQLCRDVVYYRLKQVDYDGQFTYSDLVALNCNSKNNLAVHPNPAQSVITVSYYEPTEGVVQVKIIDYIGREVLSKELKAVRGYNQSPVSIENLSEGVYYLDVNSLSKQNIEEPRRIRFIKN